MDEANARIQPQSSICSDSNGEETTGNDAVRLPAPLSTSLRLCLVGKLANYTELRKIAETFNVPVVNSQNGQEYINDNSISTIFVIENFEGDLYHQLYTKLRLPLLAPLALKQLANDNKELPDNTRPLFNLSMAGVVICFTGFRDKEDLASLVPMIHHMGGSIRKNMSNKVTHLIANTCYGEKYQYANTFRVPAMSAQWVYASWEKRHEVDFKASSDAFVAKYKLKPFHGAKVCFIGFSEDEEKHMIEVLEQNGGTLCNRDDPTCTHIVSENADVYKLGPTTAASTALNNNLLLSPRTPESLNDSILSQNPIGNNTMLNYNNFLETLHESSNHNNSEIMNESGSWSSRKRKNSSTQDQSYNKKLRDKCVSEKKRKVSAIFKTPINYFSNRRRTIDATSFKQSLNSTIISSSGVFNVETIEDLSCYDENFSTPQDKKSSLFSRTFSSSKSKLKSLTNHHFNNNKMKDLNVTRLSFDNCSDTEYIDKLNHSCFPNISLHPNNIHHELRSDSSKDRCGSSVPTVAVVDESAISGKPVVASTKAAVVKTEWFWTSVQKEVCLEEKDYLYEDYVEQQALTPSQRRDSHQATPTSASRRKRKRLDTILSSLGHQQSPGLHKRRSSVSDAGLLSVSGSFLDCTTSPDKALVDGAEPVIDTPRKGQTARQQVFLELLQTETNYVEILNTIMTMFKKHLEEMPEHEALLNNIELNLIFGKVPSIYETHVKMLDELRYIHSQWSEESSIGSVIVKYSNELLKAYPPYINYFEEMKEVLIQCDQTKPRFHAFLKACQTKPECGRQSLQELMIRPVQRLGSICLLLASILKHTPKTNPDHAALEKALAALKKVMDDINEDKRKAEGQVTLFNIFNDIDNCPPDIVSSHRHFIAKAEVVQVSNDGFSRRGSGLMLFLFSDQLEVCKKKSKAFNNLKSPSSVSGVNSLPRPKLYKHLKLLPLNNVKKVFDIKESEQCQKVFCLMCRNEEGKEKIYTFMMADEDADKFAFLRTFTRQMANNACTPDADKFLAYAEAHQLNIDTSDLNNGTFSSKAFKFASRTRDKVNRAFSFNKTPSKLKRAMSSMMSPFGSSTNLTPASELAQMRLASYSNINELGNAENASESPPVAPMSVQPTRKMKANSINVNALKRV